MMLLNRKRFFPLFLLSLACFSIAGATQNRGLIWEVSSENNKVFVLGSIHVAKEELYPLPPTIENAFDNSNILVVEMNPEALNPIEANKLMFLPVGKTLENILSPETFSLIASKFNKLGYVKEFFNRLKPWAASITLMQFEMLSSGFKTHLGIDAHFISKAKERKMPIFELESFRKQVEIFEKLSENPDSLVSYMLKDIYQIEIKIDELFDLWNAGDDIGLTKFIEDEFKDEEDNQRIREIMEFSRNREMTNKIEEYLKDNETYFVVAGSAHLVGEQGIINLLKEKGIYKIKKL